MSATGFTLRYDGTILKRGGSFMGLAGLPASPDATLQKVTVEFTKDARGFEQIKYSLKSGIWTTLFLSDSGQWENSDRITLRPIEEAAAPSTAGFILPPNISKTFARHTSIAVTKYEDQCERSAPVCENITVMAGFSGTNMHCKWDRAGNTIAWSSRGQALIIWRFEGGFETKNGVAVPRQVSYSEFDPSGSNNVTAAATYKLVSFDPKSGLLDTSDIDAARTTALVMKGHTGYGPLGAEKDPWEFYAREDAASNRRETVAVTQKTPTFPWALASLSSLAIIVILVYLGAKKFRSKGNR